MRIVSGIAIFVGITTSCCGLLVALPRVWDAIISGAGGDMDLIGTFLFLVALLSFFLFWPLAAIGLVLSTVTLSIERDKWFRLLPLVLVLAAIFLVVFCWLY